MLEKDLYLPILDWIRGPFRQRLNWRGSSNHTALEVAELDWLPPSGKWMHPDLAFVHVHQRIFDPLPVLDLHTFEVKTETSDLLQALHQTLAHGRIADFVYLVAPVTARWADEVLAQAQRFGVGLVHFGNAGAHNTYHIVHEAARNQPDKDLRDRFLDAALVHAGQKSDVLRWLGRTSSGTV